MQPYRGAQSYQRRTKQSKSVSQRQYRLKEGGGFQELRGVIFSVTGENPQTRGEILKKAAELLRQLSREYEAMSRHGTLPPLEFSSASPYEIDEGSHMSYEPLVIPNETWTSAIAPCTRNSSPLSNTSAMSLMLEYPGHPQAGIYHVFGGGSDWNWVQPTPSRVRQTSFSAQWSNTDRIPY